MLKLLHGDLSERDIGRELYVAHNTVHSHVMSIYRKLGVSSRADALQRAASSDSSSQTVRDQPCAPAGCPHGRDTAAAWVLLAR